MAKRHGKSPVAWPGGKYRLAPHLVELFPPHDVYVETCGGGGSLLFCKEPGSNEVYNDLNEGLTNFFRVTRDETSCAILLKRLALTPYSHHEYRQATKSWRVETDPIERARLWFVAVRMAFRGIIGKGWSCTPKPSVGAVPQFVSAWHNAQTLVNHAQARLSTVQVECRDLFDVLDIYDSPTTLFYIDPPYDPDTWCGGIYDHEMSSEDHQRLVARILKLKGMVILSGYPTPLYEPLEAAGYVCLEVDHTCTIGHSTKHKSKIQGTQRTECIWYRPVAQLKRQPKARPRPCLAAPVHASYITEDDHALMAV